MARNAWGADWGRYHRQKLEKKRMTAARVEQTPCIYLLYKVDDKHTWFGEPVLIIKVGKSERKIKGDRLNLNPTVRHRRLK
jgi:hypothetical protein